MPLAWRNPTRLFAYLDFTDASNRRQLKKPFKTFPQRAGRQAELPGMDWFLRVRISRRPPWAITRPIGPSHSRRLVRTPKTVIRLLPDATLIESEIPGRGREISDLLKKETQPASPPSPGPSHSIACNLEFGQYEEVFRQAREAILDGETYQIKISQRFEAQARIDPVWLLKGFVWPTPPPKPFCSGQKTFPS